MIKKTILNLFRFTRLSILLILALSIMLVGCETGGGGGNNDDDQTGDAIFKTATLVGEATQGKKVEIALFEKEEKIANEGNPYDYNYFKIMAEITDPNGDTIEMPGFYYQGTSVTLNTALNPNPSGINGVASTNPLEPQGTEVVTRVGSPHFRVRFLPSESGKYQIVFKIYKKNVLVSKEHEMEINVQASTTPYKGVLEVDPVNKRTFRFTNTEETFITIGQNTCWYTSSTRKTEDYGVWFSLMSENNMNTTRTWLAPWGFSLHSGTSYNNFDSRIQYIARLDKLVDYLEEYEIYTMFCLNNHGQFSKSVNPTWDDNPYNAAKGGILNEPYEFFTSSEAKKAYKNELMYIIARYSYSPYILCWELFNEVDWCDNYSLFQTQYKSWHQEMSKFLKDNDPYHHMVSTSYKGTSGNAYNLSTIDFVSPHDYGYGNTNMFTKIQNEQNTLFNKYQKPVFFGEIGMNWENGISNYNEDPAGISLHQAMWGGMMSGGAGGAMNWWWDSFVHPYNLYSNFKGAGAYAKEMDLSGKSYALLASQSGVSVSNSNTSIMGYNLNTRAYGYLYDKSWTYYNTNMSNKNNVSVTIPFNNGTYQLKIYDCDSGEVLETRNVNASSNKITFSVPSFRYDIAFIIE